MTDDPNDTLTTIEAKVLCLRFGLENIDSGSSVKKLHSYKSRELKPSYSRSDIAKTLGCDKNTIKHQEMNALRKLKITP